jgi:hypothetical protein
MLDQCTPCCDPSYCAIVEAPAQRTKGRKGACRDMTAEFPGEFGKRLRRESSKGDKPVPAGKRKLECGHFSQSNCISPERPGRRLIEGLEFSCCLERAYG